MRRTSPANVVKTIEGHFPWTCGDWRSQVSSRQNTLALATVMLPGILEMIDRIPEDLLLFDPATDSLFTMSVSALRKNLLDASSSPDRFVWPMFPPPGQNNHEDCLVMVKRILEHCPEEAPSKSTKGLNFITDDATREALLIDLGSAETALRNSEWKAATVLSGSVVEAMLLWVLKQKPTTDISAAIDALGAAGKALNPKPPAKDLTGYGWALHAYVEVAAELKILTAKTIDCCRNAKFYRNLIHPAVAERSQIVSGPGSAHVAIGAAYEVIRELEQ
jgi:hypothetical protein